MKTIRRFWRWTGAVMLLAAAAPLLADVSESFDGFTAGAYGTYFYNGFQMVNALCGSQNARSGNAVRLRDAASPDPNNQPYLEYVGPDGMGKDGGVGEFSFWYRNWDGSPACVHTVSFSVGGGPYQTIGTINTTSTTYEQFLFVLNIPGDDIKIRIQRESGERLLVDDFYIQDFPGGDITPPNIVSVTVVSSTALDVLFSEPVEQVSAETVGNYLILQGGQMPVAAQRDGGNPALVHLTFAPPLLPGLYTLQVVGVMDYAGNPAFDLHDFELQPGYQGTVVITEVMYDDTEPVDAEWLEIHNTTDSVIHIGGWIVTDAAEYPPQSEGWFQIPLGTEILPGQYLVLATTELPEIEGEIVCFVGAPSAFDNTGDNIALYTQLSGGQLVDGSLTVSYPDMAYSNAGNSIEKCDPMSPWSGSTAAWHQSVNFYNRGRFQSCSPGFPNSACGTRNLMLCDLRTPGVCGLPREVWNPVSVCGLVTFIDTCRSLAWLEDGCAVAIYGPATRTNMQNANRLMAAGDYVCVSGYLGFYNGLTEFTTLFSVQPVVTLLSEGNPLPPETAVLPSQISTAVAQCEAEFLESRHIFVDNLTFVEGNGSNTFAGNRNYPLISGTDTVVFRVSACDTLVGHIIPVGPISLHGILQQFDAQSCYCEGYQVVTGRLAPFGPMCPVRPPNDDCAFAIHVPGETVMPFSTVCATTDGPAEPALCMSDGDPQVGSDIWFCYVPECDGALTVSLCGSGYDTKLAIYQTDIGCTCPPAAAIIACNDNFCGLASQVTFPVVTSARYLIRIGGHNALQGEGIMRITRECPGIPCVSLNSIQLSPSDGLLNRYGRINTVRVEAVNLAAVAGPVTFTVSDCEDSMSYTTVLAAYECRLVAIPFAWTPNIECQPNFLRVEVGNGPLCQGAVASLTKPLPVVRTAYQTLALHDGVAGAAPVMPEGEDVLAIKLTPESYPCTIEYVRLTIAEGVPDSARDPIDVLIYDDDGSGGAPGTVLAEISSLVTRRFENFRIYAIPEQPLGISDGSFYVAFRQRAHCSIATAEAVCTDAAYDHPQTTFLYHDGLWVPYETVPGDLMIEAYMRCPCPTYGSSLAMGYEYRTSDDPEGPTFNWTDISTVGTAWSDSCPGCTPVPLPWPYPFGPTYYTTLKISLNGFLSFQNTGLGARHAMMPDTAVPNAVVAPLWTESESCIDYSGEVYYYADVAHDRVIVQWDSILAQERERLWFQAVLHRDGRATFQYRNRPTFDDYTVGLENGSGTAALAVYQNSGCSPLRAGMAIEFTPTASPRGPTALTCIRGPAGSNDIILRWQAAPPWPYYAVYAHTNAAFDPPQQAILLGVTTGTSFTDFGAVTARDRRFYRVVATNVPPEGGIAHGTR